MEQNKKKTIVKEAFRLFYKNGYAGTSLDSIIQNAGIPRGSFYYYFESKEGLALEVMDYYSNIFIARINKVLTDKSVSPIQRIVKLYSDYIDYYINKGKFYYGNFTGKIGQEIGENSDEVRKKTNDLFEKIKLAHRNCIVEAIRAGEIPKSRDVEKLSEVILYAWEGAAVRMTASGNCRALFVFREFLKDNLLT